MTMIRADEPQVADTARYTSTQACAALGIHRNTLHRYALQGKIRSIFRKADNRRLYTGAEIKRLWRVSL